MSRLRSLSAGLLMLVLAGCAHGGALAPEPGAPAARPTAAQLLQIAQVMEASGDTLRAQQYVLAALASGADQPSTVRWLIRLYVADSQYRLAIDRAEDQLRRRPNDLGLRMLLASLYDATELDLAAAEQYERVLAIAPNQAQAHFALGSLLHGLGQDAGRADEHFRAYLALEPHGRDAQEARALLLRELP